MQKASPRRNSERPQLQDQLPPRPQTSTITQLNCPDGHEQYKEPQSQPQAQSQQLKPRSKPVAAASSRSKSTTLTAGVQKRARTGKPTESGLLSSSDDEEDEDADDNEDKDGCNAAPNQQDDQLVNDVPDAYISAVAAMAKQNGI